MTAHRHHALFYAAGLVVQQGIGFATGAVTARWLGPSGYGALNLARSLYAVALIVAPLGLDLALLRHVGERGEARGRVLAQLRVFRAVTATVDGGVLAAIVLMGGPWLQAHVYHQPGLATDVAIAFLAAPFAADLAVVGAALRAFGRIDVQAFATLYLQPLVRAGALATLLALGFGVRGVLAANGIGVMAAAAAAGWGLRRLGPGQALSAADMREVARVYGYGGWMALTLLAYGAMRSLDVLVLAHFRPPAEVGAYAAASTIAQLVALYPTALGQSLGPAVATRFAAGDLAGVRRELAAYGRRAALTAAPLFATAAAFGPWLDVLFGPRFHFPASLSLGLAFAYYVSGVFGPMSASLSMTGRHRQELVVLVVGALGSLAGCLWMAPRFGGAGVAWAMAGGYVAVNVARVLLSIRVIGGLDTRLADIAPPAACVALACAWRMAADRWLPHDLAGAVVAGLGLLALYAAIYAAWLLEGSERRELADIVRRMTPARFARLRLRGS